MNVAVVVEYVLIISCSTASVTIMEELVDIIGSAVSPGLRVFMSHNLTGRPLIIASLQLQ